MKFFNLQLPTLTFWIVSGLLCVALLIRVVNLSAFNLIKSDEETWLLSGLSLLQKGYPESWTVFWETYGNYYWTTMGGEEIVVISPYLDHPPLFQLIIGGWALLTGNTGSEAFNWIELRFIMIAIAFLTITTTTLFVARVCNREWGILTLISISFLPSHILSSRIIAAEHLIALVLMAVLLTLYFHWRDQDRKSSPAVRWPLYSILLLSFLAPLIKLSGIIVPLVAGVLLLRRKEYIEAFLVGGSLLLSLGVFAAYGCYYDCNLFWTILQEHSLRPQTFEYFFTLFSKPDLGYFGLNDPMPVIGLVGSLVAIFSLYEGEERIIREYLLAIWLAFVFLFLVLAPVELYGWYKYLTLPLSAVGLGYIWQRLLRGQYAWSLLLTPAVLLLLENIFQQAEWFLVIRKILILILLGPLIMWFIQPEFVKRPFYVFWVYLLLCVISLLQLTWVNILLLSF